MPRQIEQGGGGMEQGPAQGAPGLFSFGSLPECLCPTTGGGAEVGQKDRLRNSRISPTIPRRKAITQMMKMTPITTGTQAESGPEAR